MTLQRAFKGNGDPIEVARLYTDIFTKASNKMTNTAFTCAFFNCFHAEIIAE